MWKQLPWQIFFKESQSCCRSVSKSPKILNFFPFLFEPESLKETQHIKCISIAELVFIYLHCLVNINNIRFYFSLSQIRFHKLPNSHTLFRQTVSKLFQEFDKLFWHVLVWKVVFSKTLLHIRAYKCKKNYLRLAHSKTNLWKKAVAF